MSRAVMWVLLGIVALAAAILSFTALRDLALAVGFTGEMAGVQLAWLLPLTIDAGAAAGCLVWLGQIEGTSDGARRFARTLTWALLFGSVAGNAVQHGLAAYGLVPSWWLVVLVSAVPPAVLGAVVHLAVQITTHVEPELATAGEELAMAGELATEAGELVADAGDAGEDRQDLVEQARRLVADGAGRPRLVKELAITDHQARQLLHQVRQEVAA